MIVSARPWSAQLRRLAHRAGLAIGRKQGQHHADSQASADWHERTPRPEAPPVRLSEPRIVPARLSATERIRLAYDMAERQMTARLDAVMLQSRLTWAQSHA